MHQIFQPKQIKERRKRTIVQQNFIRASQECNDNDSSDRIGEGRRRSIPVITDLNKFLINSKEEFENKFGQPITNKDICLEDFEHRRTIGTGSFGRVILAKLKKNNLYFAMKILNKEKIIEQKQLEHTRNEKNILGAIHFPFVVRMEYFFKDNSFIYLLMPFVLGGEMFSHLRRQGKFDEELCKFYAAQVCLALQYLHFLGLAYRDLKPENIVIERTGYLKLIDFGFCKLVRDRTYSLCGTPEYIAPEIILSKGYNHSVDWWSFGILIYEMAAGFPPFHAKNHMKLYDKIIEGKYKLAPHFSSDVKDIIFNLLQVDLTKRYGNLKDGVEDIKKHRWFHAIDWIRVINQVMEPPFIPKVKCPGDTSNYDQYSEERLQVADIDKFYRDFEDF